MRDSSQSKRKLEGKRKLPFFLVHPDSPFQSLLNACARLLNLTLSYWCNSYNDVSHRLSAWRSSYASGVFSGCSRHHGNRSYTCYNRSRQNLTCTCNFCWKAHWASYGGRPLYGILGNDCTLCPTGERSNPGIHHGLRRYHMVLWSRLA